MRQRVLCYFAAVVVITMAASNANAQLSVIQGNEISFGKIFQTGAMVYKVITVKNIGSDSIKIKSVTTSCGCTAAMVATSALAPGEESDVRIQFNPTGYIGDVTKYIYISNSDKKFPLITVKMIGYVEYALQPTPSYVLFNNARVGKLDSTEINLSNTTGKEMRITKVDLPSKELTYRLNKELLKPGDFANLDIYLNPTNLRDIDGYIVIYTTSDEQPQLQLRVFAGLIGN